MIQRPSYEDLEQENRELREAVRELDRTRRALTACEGRFTSLFCRTSDAVILQEEGKILDVNQRACRMLGYARETLLGTSFLELLPQEDREEFAQWLDDVPSEGFRVFETRWKKEDGFFTDVEMHIEFPVPNRGPLLVVGRDLTERKRARNILNISEAYLDQLFESSHTAVCMGDMDGRLLRVNREFRRLFGFDEEEVLGRSLSDIATPEDLNEKDSKTSMAAGEGMTSVYETRIRRKDGFPVDVSIMLTPIRIAEKESGFICTYRDISERRRAEEALTKEKSLLEQLFESSPTPIVMGDREGVLSRVNSSFTKVFGFTTEEAVGKTMPELIIPEAYREEAMALRDQAVKEGRSLYETVRQCKDGTLLDVLVLVTPIILDEEWIGSYATYTDITERKKTEKALRESESKYRRLFENIADPILVFDQETKRILDCNRAAMERYGYSFDEFLGMSPLDLHPPEGLAIVSDNIDNREDKEPHWYTHITKDGHTLEVETHTNEIQYHDRPAWITILRDITERRKLEEDKKKLEAQLLQGQKMEAIGTLAGGIAHDFNNLLQGVLGYAQLLLLDGDIVGRGRENLMAIEKAAKRARDLTRQLLTFSRKVESQLRPLNLNFEIREVEKILSRTIPKMIDIEMFLQDDLKVVSADPVQIEQILFNLAVNARDAMPDGGRLIIETKNIRLDEAFVRSHANVSPGEYVLLSVSDTGLGMDKKTLNHIFEPFFTTKESGQGTGLGLSMVYGIVKNHKGSIMCYSEPGSGTTFKIYLPALQQPLEGREDLDLEGLIGGSETILLVDDDETIRELGFLMLSRFGYKVLQASDGETALELYRQKGEGIALILLDVIMPGMGGIRCLEEILKENPKARVVISSGYSVNGPTKQGLESGAKSFVNKPFDVKQLISTVRQVLDRRS